jgi:hypothetical protein
MSKSPAIQLDDMLDPDSAAKWLKLSKRDFLEKARIGKIPTFSIGAKTLRFHPRTIIAKLASDAGVSFQIIAASFSNPKN